MNNGYSPSILSNDKACFICGTTFNLHRHEVFGASNRNRSKRQGCWCYLCAPHHNLGNHAVHNDREEELKLKRLCERKWIDVYNKTEDDFISEYGRSYL